MKKYSSHNLKIITRFDLNLPILNQKLTYYLLRLPPRPTVDEVEQRKESKQASISTTIKICKV